MSERVYFQEGLFEERPDGPVLLGNQCKCCGKRYFPASEFCNACLGEEFEPVVLSTKGEIYSYTITRVPVAKFPVPHAVGMISLPGDKVRLVAPLIIDESKPFRVGASVDLVVDTLWMEGDREVVGYKFKMGEEAK